ncbi:hypothetical protein RDV89_07125 [Nocardioides zeae]|uniref:Integral membrane protein n=1 Tax=Nocardioides imazamoxiresistens TaxID=3231893 RepID=A0ABU3PUC5_9ACTN|nr:hypothetical protein [Nocardioides zeae]MDT9592833.1 hypothetical protein [Nocardioides zeae]
MSPAGLLRWLGAAVACAGPVAAVALGVGVSWRALTALLRAYPPGGVAALLVLLAPLLLAGCALAAGRSRAAAWAYAVVVGLTVPAGVLLVARYGHLLGAAGLAGLAVAGAVLVIAGAASAASSAQAATRVSPRS